MYHDLLVTHTMGLLMEIDKESVPEDVDFKIIMHEE